jgi:hypothetical protein
MARTHRKLPREEPAPDCSGKAESTCGEKGKARGLRYGRRTGIAFIGLDDELVFGVVNIVDQVEGPNQKRG